MADEIKDEFNEANEAQDKFSKNYKESIDVLRDSIVTLGDRLTETLKEAINYNKDFEDSTKRIAKIYTNDISKSLDKITISLDTQYDLGERIAKGIDIGKDILKERDRLEKESSIIRRRLLVLQKAGITIDDQVNDALKERLELSETILKVLQEENKERTNSLGLTGKLVEGLDGILKHVDKSGKLSKILDLEGAIEKTREFTSKSEGPVNSFQKLGNLSKNIGSNLLAGIKGIDILAILIEQIVEAVLHSDKLVGELAKGFGISYHEAQNLKGELTSISATSSDIFVTTENLLKVFRKINETIGTRVKLNETDLIFLTKLGERAGISEETQLNLFKLSTLTGKSTEKQTKEFYGQVGVLSSKQKLVLNEKQLLEDTNKISSSILYSLRGQGKEIANAVFQAKALGTELDVVEKIQTSLLDFESSIQNQINAELLLGSQLNLEKARNAALTNDPATLSLEINKQLNSLSKEQIDNLRHNVIIQDALAGSLGISRNELTKMLMDREILQKLSVKEGETLQQHYNSLVKQYGVEKATAIIRRKTGDETLANQLASATMQEEFSQSISKLKEIFVSLAKPILVILKPIADILAPILGTLASVVQTLLIPLITAVKVLVSTIGEVLSPFDGLFKRLKSLFHDVFGGKELKSFTNLIGDISKFIFKGIFYPLKLVGESVIKFLITPLKSIIGIFSGIIDIIKGDFDSGIEKIGDSILKFLVSPIQLFLDIILGAINGIIKLSNKISGLIPGLGKIKELKEINIIDKTSKKEKLGNDIISPGYGKRTLLTPEGKIKLNDKDLVLAGTKLNESKIPGKNQITNQNNELNNNDNKKIVTNNNNDNRTINNKEINNNNNETFNETSNNNRNITNNKTENRSNLINKTENIINNSNEDVVNELRTLKQLMVENNKLLLALLNKEGIIKMDSNKVGDLLTSGANTFAIQ